MCCRGQGAPPSHSWLFAGQTQQREEKENVKSYQKGSAPSAASGNPATAKQLAAAAAPQPVLLCCFTGGKSLGA